MYHCCFIQWIECTCLNIVFKHKEIFYGYIQNQIVCLWLTFVSSTWFCVTSNGLILFFWGISLYWSSHKMTKVPRCYGPATNKWRITRQDKFYWSINWCWSTEGLFPRLSPFITLNHTSPKIS